MRLLGRCAALGVTLFAATIAFAQPAASDFPKKPVTIVVPYAAGGGADNVLRRYARGLSQLWGQPVVVENMPGGNTFMGALRVARAAPDGYTLLGTSNNTIVGNTFLFKNLPYSPSKDFIPVSMLADIDMSILVNVDFPVNSLKELVELARKDPGNVSYASWGRGSHPELLFGLLSKREGIKLLQVPYKGIAPILTAVIGGETKIMTAGRDITAGPMSTGRLKALAHMADKRHPDMPNVPTTAEAGFPYLKIATWHGMFAPAGTPPEIVEKIHRSLLAVATPEFRASLAEISYRAPLSTPAEFAASLREELAVIGEMAEAAGLQPE